MQESILRASCAASLRRALALTDAQVAASLDDADEIVRRLTARGLPADRVFESVAGTAEALAACRGERFRPRVSRWALSGGFELTCIEPDCGSDVWIMRSGDALLFIDSGYACYAREMADLLRRLFPGFDRCRRTAVFTHPDMDHCGLWDLFDGIYVTPVSWEHYRRENAGEPNLRELNPLHAPFIRLTRRFTGHVPPALGRLRVVGGAPDDGQPVCFLGSVAFEGRRLDLYRGNGGHAPGECAVVDEADRLVFSGDMLLNLRGCTPPQAAFNRLAPHLMGNVNMDPGKAAQARVHLRRRFDPDRYRYCPGHGAPLQPPGNPLTPLPLP